MNEQHIEKICHQIVADEILIKDQELIAEIKELSNSQKSITSPLKLPSIVSETAQIAEESIKDQFIQNIESTNLKNEVVEA